MEFHLSDLAGKYLLTTMTFAPLVGALVILMVPRGQNAAMKWIALAFSAIPLLLVWIPLFPLAAVAAVIFGYLGVAHGKTNHPDGHQHQHQ